MNDRALSAIEYDLAGAMVRRDLYIFISMAGMPDGNTARRALGEPNFRMLLRAAQELIQTDSSFHPALLGPGEIHPSQPVDEGLFDLPESLIREHFAVFGPGPLNDCIPYETEYCPNRDLTYRSQQMADVAGFYRAFGLRRSESARDRVDHFSIEAEFMSVLIEREIHATREGLGPDKVQVCRDAQRKFFREHLGWWIPALGTMLERQSRSRFYGAFGSFLRGFTAAERAVLDLPPFDDLVRPPVNASGIDTSGDDACNQCPLTPE